MAKRTILAAAAAILLLQGCFTIDSGKLPKTGEENVLVSNYGWYLFNVLPVACGNASENASLPWVFFRDDVTMGHVQRRFMKYAKDAGRAQMRDLAYTNSESVMFEIPGVNFPLPIPYILCYREIQLSGVLK